MNKHHVAMPFCALLLGGVTLMSGAHGDPPLSSDPSDKKLETATFGAGCFWCVETVFQRLRGVERVVSGYTGGHVQNPTYKQVCTGETGHAEAVQVRYDPARIAYADLLEVFWGTHDPTTLNRQGPDIGTQYRSAIFYHTPEQKKLAEEYKRKLDLSGAVGTPIVTEIVPAVEFYVAENYHQDYYERNGRQPYCRVMIRPKVDKLKKVFADKLKTPAEEAAARRSR